MENKIDYTWLEDLTGFKNISLVESANYNEDQEFKIVNIINEESGESFTIKIPVQKNEIKWL